MRVDLQGEEVFRFHQPLPKRETPPPNKLKSLGLETEEPTRMSGALAVVLGLLRKGNL